MIRYIIPVLLICLLISAVTDAQTSRPTGAAANAGVPTTWQAIASRIPGGLDARRIAHLEQEWQVAEIEPNLLKMTHKQTGIMKYVDITDHPSENLTPSSSEQVIDLINADTTLYNEKYVRQQQLLLVGGGLGYPMTIGDFNNNGKIDFAGTYKIPINTEIAEAAIVEYESDSNFYLRKVYTDTAITPYGMTDVDNDGLLELNFSDPLIVIQGHALANFEQTHLDSFPNVRQFTHQTWEFGGQVGTETFVDLDNDNITDILYVGTDSTEQCCHQVFVAEYDSIVNNFVRKFGVIPTPDWGIGGFGVGDLDNDGFKEFATGSVSFPAHIYMWENNGNDSYAQVYQDTMRIANAYMTTVTNDMDNNGKIELFLGGSSYSGGLPVTRIYWFEAESNNTYRKIRSFLLLGTEVLGTTVLYKHDINNDGVDDLVFCFSFSIVMLIWNNAAQEFDIFYYDMWENYDQEIHSVNIYSLSGQEKPDLFVSVADIRKTPRRKSFYYKFNPISSIQPPGNIPKTIVLEQNYPNPFNGSTQIKFHLTEREKITFSIYDLTGKEVDRLIDNQFYVPGEHTIDWNGRTQNQKEVSTGIYLYVLKAGGFKRVKKLLFIK